MGTTNFNKIKILRLNIERSQIAYEFYKTDCKFFKALRIYRANKFIYNILQEIDLEQHQNLIFDYIFHLDDWFNQFDEVKNNNNPKLKDVFKFERMEGMIPFPKNFLIFLEGNYNL